MSYFITKYDSHVLITDCNVIETCEYCKLHVNNIYLSLVFP